MITIAREDLKVQSSIRNSDRNDGLQSKCLIVLFTMPDIASNCLYNVMVRCLRCFSDPMF